MQRIIGESIQGYTHIQRNLECQDRKLSRELEDGSLVLSVADGHGSRSCPYSGTGAELAVNTFCKNSTLASKTPGTYYPTTSTIRAA